MDKNHTRALEALQPFVHLANSSASPTPRFLVNLIENATSSPSTFIFGELLESPAIQNLRSPETPEEHRVHLTLLEIFAWGTWEEYQSTPNLPTLNEAQTEKLRLLSFLTLSTTHVPLTYATLMKSLSLPDHATLEALVTKAIYSSLITARLSPTTAPPIVHVTSTAPLRDVRPQHVAGMISVLTEWQGRCGSVIGGIEAEIAKIKADAERRRAREKDRTSRMERSFAGWDGDNDGGSAGGAGGSGAGAGGAGSKHSLPFSSEGRNAGLRHQFGGGSSGQKRELNDFNDYADGSRYRVRAGRDNVNHPATQASGMDIDNEGFGDGEGSAMRRAKRILAIGATS
ncbi:hypothetical protein AJ80_01032 [Polytolypa hystricis UAMH7299]|uniref:PCI domain-containing protein n=1 Tax=Polytolypa hystricis (strain UAMH7299) TaxID=1447883 RepID=A0A2B7Z2M6_POLH7|nr:hypothetical protein AJ80_01032 [Polytolypa hystricis UAMH7299]